MKCQRCGRETNTFKGSFFNTEDICPVFQKAEEEHPMFEKARKAEHEAVCNGNYNFEGIGLPEDLKVVNK